MAEREAILGKAACLQACSRTVEANNAGQDRFTPVLKGEFAALANRIRSRNCRMSQAIRCLALLSFEPAPFAQSFL